VSPDDPTPSPAGITGSQPATTTARAGKARAGASRSGYLLPTAPPPVLISISPTGVTVGDPSFTLHAYGNSFDAGAVIQWNGVTLPTTVVTAGTHLSAPVVTASYPAATYTVTVRNASGIPSPGLPFTVSPPPPPVLDTLAPSSAVVGSANFMLTATGSAFDATAAILWNNNPLTTTRVSETTLTATVNMAGAVVGTVPVTVRNGSGLTSAALTFTVTPPPPPVLTRISPTSAVAGSAPFVLHAYGSNFKAGAVIQWAGTALTTTRISATELSAPVAPASYAVGNYAITVRNTDGGVSGTQSFAIQAAPPTLKPAIGIGGIVTGPFASRRVLVASLSIHDQLNEVPNTCTFTVQGDRPVEGAEVIIAYDTVDNPERLFAGNILRVTEVTANPNDPRRLLYQVEAIDYTWQLQARLVIGRYTNQSATDIATDLIAKWAPAGFTGQIESGLPVLDEISFTNTPLMDAFAQLARRIGGYAQGDYFKRIALWVTPTGDPPDALAPGHPSLMSLSVTRDLSQIVTRAFMEGGGVNTIGPVDPGETRIPMEDTAWYRTDGGRVVSGPQRLTYTGIVAAGGGAMASAVGGQTGNTAPSSGPTITTSAGAGLPLGTYKYAYTWVTATGECLPSPLAPFNGGAAGGPTVKPTATAASGTGLGSGAYKYAYTWTTGTGETVASPLAAVDTSATTVSPPASAPLPTAQVGVGLPNGNYWYAVTFTTAAGETTPSGVNTATSSKGTFSEPSIPSLAKVAGAGLAAGSYYYGVTFVTAYGETTEYGIPGITISAADVTAGNAQIRISNIATGPTGTTGRRIYRTVRNGAANSLFLLTTINNNAGGQTFTDATPDASLGAPIPTVNTAGTPVQQIALSSIPIGPAGVTGRKIYRSKMLGGGDSTLYLLTTIANNTATTLATPDTTPDGSLGPAAPTTNTTTIATQRVALTAIAVGPTGTTGRKIYRTNVNGSALKLVTTLANNSATTYTDATPDASLGAAPPASGTAVLALAVVGGIATGTAGLVTSRKVYRTKVNGSALFLLATIANNSATAIAADSTPDTALTVAAPTTDGSGLVSGSGGQVNAGATSIPVASTAPFAPEGWAEVGTQLIRYHGVTSSALTGIPPSGVGSLGVSIQFDAPITVAPQIIGIPASGPGAIVLPILLGDPVNLLVVADDLNAQAALAALVGGTGVVEGFEQDNRISYDEALARALARLDLKSTVQITLRYRCRDPRSRSGVLVAADLPSFALAGSFEIQDVTIGSFLGTEELPMYDVTASSDRMTFEDFLRRRRGGSGEI
jgi:IPT/TIG domain